MTNPRETQTATGTDSNHVETPKTSVEESTPSQQRSEEGSEGRRQSDETESNRLTAEKAEQKDEEAHGHRPSGGHHRAA